MRRLLAALTLLTAFAVPVALASPAAASETVGQRMLDWAEYHATGHWYSWGGIGLTYYDCSGLVYRSAHEVGWWALPRTVEEMVQSGHLVRTWHPQRGDVAVWFSGGYAYHIAFVTIWYNMVYGARHSGTQVGWYSDRYFQPTAYYHLE